MGNGGEEFLGSEVISDGDACRVLVELALGAGIEEEGLLTTLVEYATEVVVENGFVAFISLVSLETKMLVCCPSKHPLRLSSISCAVGTCAVVAPPGANAIDTWYPIRTGSFEVPNTWPLESTITLLVVPGSLAAYTSCRQRSMWWRVVLAAALKSSGLGVEAIKVTSYVIPNAEELTVGLEPPPPPPSPDAGGAVVVLLGLAMGEVTADGKASGAMVRGAGIEGLPVPAGGSALGITGEAMLVLGAAVTVVDGAGILAGGIVALGITAGDRDAAIGEDGGRRATGDAALGMVIAEGPALGELVVDGGTRAGIIIGAWEGVVELVPAGTGDDVALVGVRKAAGIVEGVIAPLDLLLLLVDDDEDDANVEGPGESVGYSAPEFFDDKLLTPFLLFADDAEEPMPLEDLELIEGFVGAAVCVGYGEVLG